LKRSWVRRTGPPRSIAELDLPLMGLVALLVGLGIAVWLNSLGGSTGGTHEIRQVTERPATAFDSPQARLALAAAAERAHERAVHARRVRHRRRVAAQRRAAARARRRAAPAAIDPRYPVTYGGQQDDGNPYYEQAPAPQTVTQQAPNPEPAPKPKPKRSGGGGSTPFDDSG
jgi:hypothetical protein